MTAFGPARSRRTRLLRGGERGIAILTAIWMTIIGVMLVTTISTIITGSMSLSANSSLDAKARIAAQSGVMKAIGLLIADRPSIQAGSTGLVVTEVRHKKVSGMTVRLNGFLQDIYGTTDSVALFNYGTDTVDISGWWIDDDGTVNDVEVPASTLLPPLTGIWVGGAFPTTAQTLTLYTSYANETAVVDTWEKPAAAAGDKYFCLPDGSNNDSTRLSYWKLINASSGTFQHLSNAVPPPTRMNGRGMWLDSYVLEKHVGTRVDTTLAFSPGTVFIAHDSTVVVRSPLSGWTLPLATPAVLSGGESLPRLNNNAVPGSDSIAFVLRRTTDNAIVTQSGSINNSTSARYTRSGTDPMATMTAGALGAVSAGTPDATYSSNTLYISEVHDPSDTAPSSLALFISKVVSGITASTAQEAIELYNASSSSIDLATNPLTIWTHSGTVGKIYLNAGTIPAYGFYLWSDIASCTTVLGTAPDTINATGTGQVNISNSQTIGLYDGSTWLDTGWAATGTENTRERMSASGVTAASMAVGGSNVDKGNSFRSSTPASSDFVEHSTTAPATVQWKNRTSTTEVPAGATPGDNADEFVEIALGPDPDAPTGGPADRRYEYIEFQNNDTQSRDVVTGSWWVSVGSNTAANKRYIYPLFSGSATLAAGAIGVIVATDADTPAIAALSGKTTSQINWFGLGPSAGSAVDTLIGANAGTTLHDRSDTVVIGYGGAVPGAAPYWYGAHYADTTGTVLERSWTKQFLSQMEDTTSPFTGTPIGRYELRTPTPGDGLSSGGRDGYDGAGDTWYALNYDSFTLHWADAAGNKFYYRVRVFDEGAKVNVNAVAMKGYTDWETGLMYHMLNQNPNPPFASAKAYNLAPAGNDSNCMQITRELISMWRPTASAAKLVTPGSIYMVRCTEGYTGSLARNTRFDSVYMPFTSVYGYNEQNVLQININTADTPVLRAAFILALARNPADQTYPYVNNAIARGRAEAAADSIFRYLTKNDTNLANDTGIRSLSTLHLLFTDADSTRTAVLDAYTSGKLAAILATNSTNYFTVYATGFAYGENDNPLTDTPLATARIYAVVRRFTTADKAEIVYWRENFEVASHYQRTMVVPVSVKSRRYPKYAWDPDL